IKHHVAAVAKRSPQVVTDYRENLIKRLRDADLELDVEDDRVLKEVCLFADRCDITEEITRLDSHLDQFEGHLKGDGEIGRKAEFILQEIGREIHTIGSKANDLQLSKHVIELKNELERIREQIANVE
ncbi:MAG: endoribonuclease YicC domain-containing protein, partial [Verrucomicrobiia bacterium]